MAGHDGRRAGAALAGALEEGLRALGSPERAEHERAYLRSELVHLGVTVPAIRRTVVSAVRAGAARERAELLGAVEALWSRGIHECRMAAVELLDARSALLGSGDLELLERLLREARTWALVDPLAIDVVGALHERHPAEVAAALDRWARAEDLWLRRSALLALLHGLRGGEGDLDRFLRYADEMLDERAPFIRKAIGWVLRETGRRRPEVVAEWVADRIDRVSGVTLREAVKRLPDGDRERLLAAYRLTGRSRAGRSRAQR
jgi:3-methyladenine DNA glycosylase AlkD